MSKKISSPRSSAPFWLAVPPVLAMLGGFTTLYIAYHVYPDTPLQVEKVSEVRDVNGDVHQHVTNSVTPPLK